MDVGTLIAAIREAEAVRFGEFELSTGGTSSYYVDKYVFETDPHCLELIARALAERVDDETLAGVALGAVPLATATSLESGRPYVIVRKDEKDYGTGNLIEGTLPEDGEVVVVEDVTTTGRSAAAAVEALRAAGATVRRVLVVVDREEGAAATLADVDAELEALVTASDLLAEADLPDAGD